MQSLVEIHTIIATFSICDGLYSYFKFPTYFTCGDINRNLSIFGKYYLIFNIKKHNFEISASFVLNYYF